jgi:ACS family sodium-dependent inorganic phosphate cotransporter
VCHFCHNWGTFILLTWMPTYYNQVLGLDLRSSGLFSVLPWVTMAIAANVGGWIADTLVERGWSVTHVRKIMQTVSAGGVRVGCRGAGRQAGQGSGQRANKQLGWDRRFCG